MELAERQHGVVTFEQGRACGLSEGQIRRRVDGGRWVALGRGVYRIAGSPPSWEQRLIGLTFAAGPAAAASHRSAAALLGIPGFERRGLIEVTTPRPRRHRTEGQLVHRWRPFPDHHLTLVEGIVTTRVARLARLLIELDSRRHHSSKLDREADEVRDRRLEAAGWRVVRFTWDDLVTRPDWVVSELRRLLGSAAA